MPEPYFKVLPKYSPSDVILALEDDDMPAPDELGISREDSYEPPPPEQVAATAIAHKLATGIPNNPILRHVAGGLAQAGGGLKALGHRVLSLPMPASPGFQAITEDFREEQSEKADEANRATDIIAQALQQSDVMTGTEGREQFAAHTVGGAARSLSQMAVAMPFGVVGMIGLASGVEGNQAITEAKDKGLTTPETLRYAATAAAIEGVIAGLFQKIGYGGLESLMAGKAVAGTGFRQAMRQAGIAQIQELPEEVLTEVLHNVNRYANEIDETALTKKALTRTIIDTIAQTVVSVGTVSGLQVTSAAIAAPIDKALRGAKSSSRRDVAAALGLPPGALPKELKTAEQREAVVAKAKKDHVAIFEEAVAEAVAVAPAPAPALEPVETPTPAPEAVEVPEAPAPAPEVPEPPKSRGLKAETEQDTALWALSNPEGAVDLLESGETSSSAFEDVGLYGLDEAERRQTMADLRSMEDTIKAVTPQVVKPEPVEVLKAPESVSEVLEPPKSRGPKAETEDTTGKPLGEDALKAQPWQKTIEEVAGPEPPVIKEFPNLTFNPGDIVVPDKASDPEGFRARQEWEKRARSHHIEVGDAISRGDSVPNEVLAEFPDHARFIGKLPKPAPRPAQPQLAPKHAEARFAPEQLQEAFPGSTVTET